MLAPIVVTAQQAPEKSKSQIVLLSIQCENEGPSGLWVQSGRDLSTKEPITFRQQLESSLLKVSDIHLVTVQDKRDHVELAVSLTKVRRGNGTWWYAASSVIGLAKPKIDEFVSHSVIVGENIQTVANAVGFSFASIRLRVALGIVNN